MKVILSLIILCITSSAFAYTPYNTNLVSDSCFVDDSFERNHPTIYIYNSEGVIINILGAEDGGRFQSKQDAISALENLASKNFCPSGWGWSGHDIIPNRP